RAAAPRLVGGGPAVHRPAVRLGRPPPPGRAGRRLSRRRPAATGRGVYPARVAAARPDAPLVTPEAVVVDLPLAGVGTRAAALALDLLIQFAATLVLVLLLGVAVSRTDADVPAWVVVVAFLTLYVAVFWGYPIAMETLTRGRTVGKLALGLRVVTVEGAPVRFRHAFIRAAFGLVDVHLLSGLIGLVTALTTRRTQRL